MRKLLILSLLLSGLISCQPKEETFVAKLKLTDLQGQAMNAEPFKNKVVILNLWATWCKPCIKEMPDLVQMQNQLPDDFVLLLASDESIEKIQQFIERRHIELTFVQTQTSVESLGVYSLPTTFIIGKDGQLLETLVGAQQIHVSAGTDVLLQYKIGGEVRWEKFSAALNVGMLTSPYDDMILNTMEQLGVDQDVVFIIEDVFSFGVIPEVRVNYHINKRWFAGAYFQLPVLVAGDAPTEGIEVFLDDDLSNFPLRNRDRIIRDDESFLTLNSTLYQLGIQVGAILPINARWDAIMALGCSKNVGSQSKLTSEFRDIGELSATLNEELVEIYRQYAYLPILNLTLSYKLR